MEKTQQKQAYLPLHQGRHGSPEKPKRSDTHRGYPRQKILTYLVAIAIIYLLVTYSPILSFSSRYTSSYQQSSRLAPNLSRSNTTNLVSLEAHIMSKCPDARDCLRDLVVPAMEQVVDKVDFRLSYIGKVDGNDTIQCMHGATECLGNMLGLCANELYPNSTKISLGFAMCLIDQYKRIPDRELVENCALEHSIAFTDLNACISEEGKGLDLLEASVQRSENAGVKKSCTVRMGGQEWCVRDGGQWKNCNDGHKASDLVQEVERRYKPQDKTRLVR